MFCSFFKKISFFNAFSIDNIWYSSNSFSSVISINCYAHITNIFILDTIFFSFRIFSWFIFWSLFLCWDFYLFIHCMFFLISLCLIIIAIIKFFLQIPISETCLSYWSFSWEFVTFFWFFVCWVNLNFFLDTLNFVLWELWIV